MAIDKLTGLEDNTKPLNKNLTKDITSIPISTATTPLTKTYVDKTNIDIDAYQKEKATSQVGFTLTPDSFIQNQPKIQEFKKEQEVLLNDYKAYNQGLGEKVYNGLAKFSGRVYTSVAGSTIGSLYGLYSWAKDGEFKSFYDNEFQHYLDGINDSYAQEYKHYYTSSKDDWEIGNFIFDKVFDGLGFATGAVLSSMIGSSVTGALSKSFKLTNSLKAKAVDKLLETNKTASTTQKVINTQNTANQIANLDRLSKLPQQMSGLVTGAVYESGVEARHGYSETREILIDTYKQMHEGKAPIGKDLDEINEIAGRTANGIFAANMVVVGGGNILQFGKHLGLDFSDYTKVFKPNVAKEFIDETGKQAFKKTGSQAYRVTKGIVKNAVVESQEEMIQSVISGTGKDYALTKYNNEGKADLNDLLNSSIKSFKKTYGSSEGWEEGLIGAIVGSAGVISPRSRTKADGTKQLPITLAGGIRESIKEYRNEEARRNQIVANLNEKGSITSLNESVKHHIRDRKLSQVKDEAVDTGNEMLYKNAEDDSFHSFVTSRLEAGMINSVYRDLSDLQSKTLDEFKSIFGIPEDADFSEETKHKQIKSFEERAKSIEQSTKFVDKVYQGNNPTVREALIYNQSMINRIDKRKSNLREWMQALSGISINLNTNEEGKIPTKEELFKEVEPRNQIHKSTYETYYDDYFKLETRSNKMLSELLSLLDSKSTSEAQQFIEEGLSEVEKQEELAKAKREESKKEEQKLKKAEELKKQKDTKNKDKEVISSMFNSLSEQVEIGDNQPIQMTAEDIQTVVKNINDLKTKEEFDKFIKDLKGNIKLLPMPIQEAIIKKVDEYGKELSKLTQEDVDPINASGNTTVDDTVKENINSTINESTDLNEPPIDATKEDTHEEDLSTSHEGKTKTGINNEEVRENGKEIYTVDGRLLDAHNTIANSTRLYRQDENNRFIRLNEINPNTNPDVLSSEKLLEGTKLKIELFQDEFLETFNTDGTAKDQKDWLKNTFNSPNQIMVVKDMNDIVVGYLHEEGYITANRVYELRGKDDNLEINKQLLLENRTKVFDHISKNGTPYQVTVQGKTSGNMFVQQSERYNVPLSEAISNDNRPQILVVKNDGFWLGQNHVKDTELNEKLYKDFSLEEDVENKNAKFFEKYRGATVIAVPSANGSYLINFVKNKTLSENQNLKSLIKDVLIAYIKQDEETLSKYDLDLNDITIQNFLSNYLYTVSDFNSPHTFSLKTDANTNKPRIIFKDVNGNNIKLDENTLSNKGTVSAFEERLNKSMIAVNLNAYTNNEYIKYKDKEGLLKDIKYRDMLQDNLYVNFLGNDITRTDGKQERVYTANPIIALDFNNSIQLTHEPKAKEEDVIEINEEDFLMFDENNNVTNQVSQVKADQSDIEAKKAYIERRRQEELNDNKHRIVERVDTVEFTSPYDGTKCTATVQYFKDGSAKIIQFDSDGKRLGEIKVNKELVSKTKKDSAKIVDLNVGEDSTVLTTKKINNEEGSVENKINAKYDAELKALEQQHTTSNKSEIEAKKADIERRRQEELKERVIYDRKPTIEDGEFRIIGDPNRQIYRINENTGRLQVRDRESGLWTVEGTHGKIELETAQRIGFEKLKENINAKYDAELAELEKSTPKSKKQQIAEIERRRQEELENGQVNLGDIILKHRINKYGATENEIINNKTGEGVFQLITKDGNVSYAPIIGKNFIESISKFSGKNIEEQTEVIFSGIPIKELIINYNKQINAKYDAELVALEQPDTKVKQPDSTGKVVSTKGTMLGSMIKKNKKVTSEDKKTVSLENKKNNVSNEEAEEAKKRCNKNKIDERLS